MCYAAHAAPRSLLESRCFSRRAIGMLSTMLAWQENDKALLMSDPVAGGIARAGGRIAGGLFLAHLAVLGAAPVAAHVTIATQVELGHLHATRGEYVLAIDVWVEALD